MGDAHSDASGQTGPSGAEIDPEQMTTSTRDPKVMADQFERWLAGRLSPSAHPKVMELNSPQGNGMSSETLLVTARWTDEAGTTDHHLVARVAPPEEAHPVFPTYDLGMQYQVMRLVASATDVPVPATHWFEDDAGFLGGPFFVMDQVVGQVPPDVLPYTFGDNWLFDASLADQQRVQESAVGVLAGIHAVTPDRYDLDFLQANAPGESTLDRSLAHWSAYRDWVVEDRHSPLLDACFAWLVEHQPEDVSPDALSWGDGRIGNMLFRDFEAVAVLDWEMASVAPPEVDLGWMCYLHLFFQDLAVNLGAPGLPGLFRPVDVKRTYQEITGREVGDLQWYIAYAAMRHGVIMRRVTERAVLFGEAAQPEDIDDLIMHRTTLEGMLDGSYWAGVAMAEDS